MFIEKKINFRLLNKFLIPIFGIYFFLIVPSTLPNFYPMFIDSGTYGYVAQQINKGKLLYKEIFEIKLPGIYYIYAFLFKIFTDSRWVLYFVDLIHNFLILFFIYLIFKRENLIDYYWLFSIFFITCLRVYPSYCDGNLNEHWYLFFFLLFYYLINSEKNKIKELIAGFSFSYLFFLKQNFIFLNIPLIYFFRKKMKNYFFILGFLPMTLFFLYIIIKSWPESLKAIFLFPLRRSGEEKMSLILKLKTGIIYGPFLQFLILFILSCIKNSKIKRFIILQGLILLFITFFLPLFYIHYLVLLLILTIPSFTIIGKEYPKYFCFFLLFFLIFPPFKFIKIRFKHSFKALRLTLVEKDLRLASPPMAFTIIKYLKENEKFIMIPSYPEIYFMTKTESPYRFFLLDDLVSKFFKEEFKKMIKERPPDYVYLEKEVSYFEKVFYLDRREYELKQIDENLFKFKILR
ncbi:MAG: hypothetical protein NC926_00910 [Candidatus Omnitrophica bacterium]|nr:hypothetical protein [Candidatus Omnitrophota bacterium]MCM8806511.1 hypothetical protein [Candidatus Omnitrophota bacterium]